MLLVVSSLFLAFCFSFIIRLSVVGSFVSGVLGLFLQDLVFFCSRLSIMVGSGMMFLLDRFFISFIVRVWFVF